MNPKSTGSEARTDLLKIASDVANRRYLPDLWNCRTIGDARLVLADYDQAHMALVHRLKGVIDRL